MAQEAGAGGGAPPQVAVTVSVQGGAMDGAVLTIALAGTATVAALRREVHERTGMAPKSQMLIFTGRPLGPGQDGVSPPRRRARSRRRRGCATDARGPSRPPCRCPSSSSGAGRRTCS